MSAILRDNNYISLETVKFKAKIILTDLNYFKKYPQTECTMYDFDIFIRYYISTLDRLEYIFLSNIF